MIARVTTYWLEIALVWLGLSCLIGLVWSAIGTATTCRKIREDRHE